MKDKGNGSYSNKYSKLSYEIKEDNKKAIVTIQFEIIFPFKFLARQFPLKMLKIHQEINEICEKYGDSPQLEIVETLAIILEKLESKEE